MSTATAPLRSRRALAGVATFARAAASSIEAQTPPAPAASAPAADAAAKPKGDDAATPDAKVWTSTHELHVGGAALRYVATAGTLRMKDAKGEPAANFGFTAYVRQDGDPRTRPIVFAYNGGPGSSSIWLHMGILGPRRTVLADLEANTTGPFRSVENEYSVLAAADLVMIDPVGTGLSRPVGAAKGKDFWGVDNDIRSVSDFIAEYVSRNGRWLSPKFLLGESYGGMRSGGVAYDLLARKSLGLNGVVLVSPFMDYVAGAAGFHQDLPYVNFLPAFAAVAWFHHRIEPRPAELAPFLREVEKFSRDVYAPVLLAGRRATPEARQAALAGLAQYTGISADYWERADLRMDEDHFTQELQRASGQVTGRIDARFRGAIIDPLAETSRYDPYSSAVGPAVVATFNDYYRGELGVDSDAPYVASAGLWEDWDFGHREPGRDGPKVPVANTAVDLAQAMIRNPKMRVLVFQGWYDLATPYAATEYFIDHLDLPAELRANVAIRYFEAGHMMYVHPPSMALWKSELDAFLGVPSR